LKPRKFEVDEGAEAILMRLRIVACTKNKLKKKAFKRESEEKGLNVKQKRE
jgi:hypothetical protein